MAPPHQQSFQIHGNWEIVQESLKFGEFPSQVMRSFHDSTAGSFFRFSIKCVILMMSRVSNGGHDYVQSNMLEIAGNEFPELQEVIRMRQRPKLKEAKIEEIRIP